MRDAAFARHQEAVIEAYLLGKIDREEAISELGQNKVEEIEYERDVVNRDFEWGLKGN